MSFYKEFVPTRGQRFWRALGFAWGAKMPRPDDREGFAPGYVSQIIRIRFSWVDRLRVLVSGHVLIGVALQTDCVVHDAVSSTETVIAAPYL